MSTVRGSVILLMLFAVPAFGVGGAQATFSPGHVDNLFPGVDLLFSITVSVGTLSGFNVADIVIGSDDATDIYFSYGAVEKVVIG